MKVFTILFLFVVSSVFAQDPITYNLGDFSTVKVFSGLNVQLIKAAKSSIEISGNNSDAVIVKNVNGTLKISVKLAQTFSANDIKVKVFFAKDLTIIDANEGCVIKSDSSIKQNNVEVRAQEGSFIEIPIETSYLKVKSVSGSQIILSGATNNQNVDVNTGGIYTGFDLISKNATVSAATGGSAKIKATELLDANVKLGGAILYKGKPKTVNSKTVLGGSINSLD